MNEKPIPLFESLAAVFGVAVVAILVAFPSFGKSEAPSQEVALQQGLAEVRHAIERAVADGVQLPAESSALEQLLLEDFLIAFPENPINQRSGLRVNGAAYSDPHPNGTAGWLYLPDQGRVVPDLKGRDSKGKPFLSY